MEVEVKFCPCNFEDEMEKVKEKLMEYRDVSIWEERCLLYCGQCLVKPFAVINGEHIIGGSPEDLLEKVERHLYGLKGGSM